MKPFKLLACLVTLQFTSGLTLQAADPQNFRQWTDATGRTIVARLVDAPDAESVKIERQDGRVFTVAIKTFSAEDQTYVNVYRAGKTSASATSASSPPTGADDHVAAEGKALAEATAATWKLLNAGGTQAGATYANTHLEDILAKVNQRFAAKAVTTPAGLPLKIRTEPAGLGARVLISGELPSMTLSAFLKEVARINDLAVTTDAAGMVVLVDKGDVNALSFLGVAASP